MEGNRFDDLVRGLASGTSRRRALKTLVTGIGGAAIALTGLDKASARRVCRVNNQVCRKPGDCCGFFCGPPDFHHRQRCGVCPNGGSQCGTGECCTEGQQCIDGHCCDNPCGPENDRFCCGDQSCVSNFSQQTPTYTCCAPELACNDNTVCCAGTDSCILGACCAAANVCSNGTECCQAGQTCTAAGCCSAPCAGPGDCSGGQSCCNGCCSDTQSDPQNCNGCGNDCGFYAGNPSFPNCCVAGVCHDFFSCR